METIRCFFDEVNLQIQKSIDPNKKKNTRLIGWFDSTVAEMCQIWRNMELIKKRVGDKRPGQINLSKVTIEDMEACYEDASDLAKKIFNTGMFQTGLYNEAYRMFLDESKTIYPIIDSMTGKYRDIILNKLYTINDTESKLVYAKVTSEELDSLLYLEFEEIQLYEQKGYNFTYTKRDTCNVVNDIISAFNHFNIDIIPMLKVNSEFERNFGSYEYWFDLSDDIVEVIESKTNLSSKYDIDQLKLIHPKLNQYLTCDLNSWLYWFGGVSCIDPQKIKWILLNRQGKPHKTALREFLLKMLSKTPTPKIIDSIFTDANGKPIKLAKSKTGEYSNYYSEIESLI